MRHLIRQDLTQFEPYSTARQESEAECVALDANELPWDMTQLSGVSGLNRYPEPQSERLLELMAGFYGVSPANIHMTRGSGEGIDLLLRLLVTPNKEQVITMPPTFSYYEKAANIQGITARYVPLASHDFTMDAETVISESSSSSVKAVFICSPNNPTGNCISQTAIIDICRRLFDRAVIVVDEAYIEFADQASLARWVDDYPNLVVLRSLSKSFGLAGARIGAVIANQTLISFLAKVAAPYPLTTPSIEAAAKALDPNRIEHFQKKWQTIKAERQRLKNELEKLDITEHIWPSQANFMLARFSLPVCDKLNSQGVTVRNMSQRPGVDKCVRITVGTENDNDFVINAISEIAYDR